VRRAALALAALALAALAAPAAEAHPLGNFSVNHLSLLRVSQDRVEVRYVLDQAEIPTAQERGLDRTELLRRKVDEIERGLALVVDSRRAPLAVAGRPRLSFPAGAAGLPTTRLELSLRAPSRRPRRVELRDGSFAGRVGWRAIVAVPGSGTAVRSSVPSRDPTGGLRRYPQDVLESPADDREALLRVEPGDGTVIAPKASGGEASDERASGTAGFAGLFEDAASGRGVPALLLVAAFGWGALHALSPGHGKAMVAGYLVGTRGTARHAVALGGAVTVAHTAGVFALGAVTLALSQYVLAEDLYPWLTLVSGLLVLTVGAGVLRSRLRRARSADGHGHAHGHRHHHGHRADLSWKGLAGMGTAAGLIPCPSALVVLLAAVSQHEVALGLVLILAFSLGLAATLSAAGLAVVFATRLAPPRLAASRLAGSLPAASALLIVAVGAVLTARAVPGVI
jgi:ABC-type nickel/cobalt efflux system permease component RcnA